MCRRIGPRKGQKKDKKIIIISALQQSDSIIHIHTSILFQILFRCSLFSFRYCIYFLPLWQLVFNFISDVLFRKEIFFFFYHFLGPHLQHMEVSGLGIQLELKLLATDTKCRIRAMSTIYTTAHGNARFPSPLSEARDQTCILTDTSRIGFCYPTIRIPMKSLIFLL